MARIGEIIDGKYEVLREIGRGGMSVVYLAMDKRLNKQWAIKEFRKDKDDASRQVALKALLDEANLMKKLDHPTLPRIVDIINLQTSVFIVMDYIEGESLNKVLDNYGAQPQEAVIEWAKQLSDVLDYLHTQHPPVIYRDMKPANIMLKPDGTVRLIDFGIAREYKEGKAGDTEAIGTRGYAAPEQFGGRGQTDARTDIYSLGVTLYHLVTGQNPAEPPYEIYPIRHWNPSLSSGLEWLIQKCTQLNPGDRYQSCAEVSYVLDNLEKFEGEYKRKQHTRINLFIVSSVLTIVFAILTVLCFVGNNVTESQNIDKLMEKGTVEAYVEVLELHPDYVDAYVALANELRATVAEIVPGGDDESFSDNLFYHNDIFDWFADMDQIKDTNPKEYALVNYELGRLYWNFYSGERFDSGMIESYRYFSRMLDICLDNDEICEYIGASKVELAEAYIGISFFALRQESMDNADDGDFKFSENDTAMQKILNAGQSLAVPYYDYWRTCQNLATKLETSTELTDVVRVTALDRLSVILNKDYKKFKTRTEGANVNNVVDGDDMVDFFESISRTMNDKIVITSDNREALLKIQDNFNSDIKNVNETFGTDILPIDVPELKIEENSADKGGN